MKKVKKEFQSVFEKFRDDKTGEITNFIVNLIDLFDSNIGDFRNTISPYSVSTMNVRQSLIKFRNEFGKYLDDPIQYDRNDHASISRLNTNNETLDYFINDFKKIRDILKTNEEVKNWFSELSNILKKEYDDKTFKGTIKRNFYKRMQRMSYDIIPSYLFSNLIMENEAKEDRFSSYLSDEQEIEKKFIRFCNAIFNVYSQIKMTLYLFSENLKFINSEISNIDKKISPNNYILMSSIGKRPINEVKTEYQKYLDNLKTQTIKMKSKYNNILKESVFEHLQVLEL